ncbi:MAG TPA: VOC family protein, partial [Gemmataceae bacterium]|nr:VOC family protein [Gemmataceae bacterium]
MDRAVRFYELLGIRFDREQHGAGPEHMAARIGAALLEIYPLSAESNAASIRLGFRVSSVDRVLEAVQQAGGVIVTPPKRGPWGYRAYSPIPTGDAL